MNKVISNLVSDLKKYSPDKIILFGSRARDEAERLPEDEKIFNHKSKK